KIDLGGFGYDSAGETVSWTQSGTSGTLTVNDGAKTASLTLLGIYSADSFHLANAGHGGTYVFVQPAARFAQALAVFGGGSALPAGAGSSFLRSDPALLSAPALTPAATSGG